jgi:hypothetical protein
MVRNLGVALTAALFVLMSAGPALPQHAEESTAHGSTVPTQPPSLPQNGQPGARANAPVPSNGAASSRFPGIYEISVSCDQNGDSARVGVRIYNDYYVPVFLEYGERPSSSPDLTWSSRMEAKPGLNEIFYLNYNFKCGSDARWALRYVRFGNDSGPYASGEALPATPAPVTAFVPRRAYDSPPSASVPNPSFPGIFLHYDGCTQEGDYAKFSARLFNDYLAPVFLEFGETWSDDYTWTARMEIEHGDSPVFYQTLIANCKTSGHWKLRDIRFGTDSGPYALKDPAAP